MINNLGRMCPNYCSHAANNYSGANSFKITQAIVNTAKELLNKILHDPDVNQPEIIRLLITVKIERIFPELNKNFKTDDDLFDLKKDIIDETFDVFLKLIKMHAVIQS